MSYNQKCNMKIFCIELRNRIFNSVTVKYYVFLSREEPTGIQLRERKKSSQLKI